MAIKHNEAHIYDITNIQNATSIAIAEILRDQTYYFEWRHTVYSSDTEIRICTGSVGGQVMKI